ncbi:MULTISPECIES: VOC family protein [unclassified Brucella]|uniref:VOC family protein n=1 Tax=unclassified Brucella TaxID=2632610 RepID=UPI00217F05FA|nr:MULTISPECIES: VOC family protein [unclassified Brucella]UWF67877.1 VOC family protein [Brucella sp. 1315]UWF70996.1 VOC family protein [Brucella sp. 2594]
MTQMTAPLEVGLAVRDLKRMRAFYEGALGLSFVSEIHVGGEKAKVAAMSPDGYTVIRLQTAKGERIKLLQPDRLPQAGQAETGLILERAGSSYLTFIVDDLKALVERLIEHGAQPLTGRDPIEVRPGTWLAFLHDPEGHIVEIVQYDDIAAYRPDLAEEK